MLLMPIDEEELLKFLSKPMLLKLATILAVTWFQDSSVSTMKISLLGIKLKWRMPTIDGQTMRKGNE